MNPSQTAGSYQFPIARAGSSRFTFERKRLESVQRIRPRLKCEQSNLTVASYWGHSRPGLTVRRDGFLFNSNMYISQFRTADPERAHRNKMNRSNRMAEANKLGRHTREQWLEMKAEFGGRCVICGGSDRIECSHIVPVRFVGDSSNGMENIQPTCCRCNISEKYFLVDFRPARRKFGFNAPQGIVVGWAVKYNTIKL